MTANRSMPNASATLATSAAADATSRPGWGVDPPEPGRSYDTQRIPRSAAAGSRGSGGAPMLGVPWGQNTARQPSAPSAKASYACSVRPSLSNRSVCVTTRRAYLVTVTRLRKPGRVLHGRALHILGRHECMISIARDTTKNVKRWRDGKMLNRWCAAGMLNPERSVGRRKGYRQMPRFVAALARHLQAVAPAWDAARVA